MASLSESQIAALKEVASVEEVDPEELIAVAQGLIGEKASDGLDVSVRVPEALRPFLWNSWFLRVREIRSLIGLTERIEDDDMPVGKWLLKHGGSALTGTQMKEEE